MIEEYTTTGNTEACKTYKVIDPEGSEYGFFKSINEAKEFIEHYIEENKNYYNTYFSVGYFIIEEMKLKGKLDYAIDLLEKEIKSSEDIINLLKKDGVWKHYKDLGWGEPIESYREAIKILEEHNG